MKKLVLLATAFLCVAGTQVLAADSDSKTKNEAIVNKETREQMAANHDKMAQCLRSDKSLEICRDEMHAECENMPGEYGCMMMNRKGKGKMRSR